MKYITLLYYGLILLGATMSIIIQLFTRTLDNMDGWLFAFSIILPIFLIHLGLTGGLKNA